MHIDFNSLSSDQRYHLMTQIIVPRPIAWVLTDNGLLTDNGALANNEAQVSQQSANTVADSYNLAPFSYFNAVSSEPALIMLSIGAKPNGEVKDTRRNILERKHCVVHIPSVDHARAVSDSAASLPFGESEIEKLNLSLVKQVGWPLPRLTHCKVALACELYDYMEVGPSKQGVLFCEIKNVHIDDWLATEDEKQRIKVDARVLAPLARLGANEYATLDQVFRLDRPK